MNLGARHLGIQSRSPPLFCFTITPTTQLLFIIFAHYNSIISSSNATPQIKPIPTSTTKHNTINMDFVKNFTGGDKDNGAATQQNQQRREGEPAQENKEEGGFLSGIGNKLNSAAGGGKESEKNEDYLDKGSLPPSKSPSHLVRCPWLICTRYRN